jgi:hypothetical protein
MQAWQEFIGKLDIQPLQKGNSLCVLDQLGLLYVGGDDAQTFLQNQLSNDIQHIDANKSQISSFSNAKGRMLAIMRVIQIDGGYLLLLPRENLVATQQLLQKYVIMSRVVMADISDSFARFSLATDQAEITNKDSLPSENNQVLQTDSLITLRLTGGNDQQRYLFLSNNADEAIELFSHYSQFLTVNNMDSWHYQEISSGVPTIYPSTREAFVLQMCNLDLIDGVSFKKGCYPGQEIVARTHYLGKQKRRMYVAEVGSSLCPIPGDELKSRNAVRPDGSGKVVDAVKLDDAHCLMLFSAKIDKTESNELVLVNQSDSSIILGKLPYSLPE